MRTYQTGILSPLPLHARYLTFRLDAPGSDPAPALAELARRVDGDATVAGLGASLLQALGWKISGLVDFPGGGGPGLEIPSTPAALWLWLRGEDRGELLHRSLALENALAPAFRLVDCLDAFRHGTGRDITGFEDGTENPQGEAAVLAAFTPEGASFVAVQRWRHDMKRFDAMGQAAQDRAIGRRRSDNEELEDAPESAHVRRTAQESFTPEAYLLRRSMPWVEACETGLVFVAFGRNLEAFEAQLRRMTGQEDGITDALFGFTRPVTGAHFWCPPMRDGHLDLAPG